MVSQARRKKKVDRVSLWRDSFPKVLNSCLLVCCLFNFLALAWGVRSSSPKAIHHIDSTVTNHFFVVTQFVASVSSPFPPAGSVDILADRVGKEIPITYHFMVADSVPMFKYYGQYYREGDLTSYGRIKKIFPDRVLLDGPVYLRNSINPDEVRPTPHLQEVKL